MATEEKVRPIQSLAATGADLGRVLADHRGERHLVILPHLAGPDAIACAFAHQLISAAFDVETGILQPDSLTRRQDRTLKSPASGDFEIPVGFLSGGGDSYRDRKWRLFDAQIKYRILARIGVEHEVL